MDCQSMQAVLERSHLIDDDFGANIVHYAARNGSTKILKFLVITCRMSATVRNSTGSLPTHEAAAFGKLSALSWLIQNTDASITERDNFGHTYLHLAARYGIRVSFRSSTRKLRFIHEMRLCVQLSRS